MLSLNNLSRHAWPAYILATLFYAYQFALRVAPSVMGDQLMDAFAIGTTTFGLMASFYYYGYALFQVPAGAMCDLLSPRLVLSLSLLGCVAGQLLFLTGSLYMAFLGRLLIGLSSATSFVLCLKVAAQFFPSRVLPTLTAVAVLVGTFGCLGGGAPIAYSTRVMGWMSTTWLLTAMAGLLIIVGMLLMPGRKHSPATPVDGNFREALKGLIKAKHTWVLGAFGLLAYTPMAAFCDLWGVPFLERVYTLSTEKAAFLISITYIGLGLGSLLGPLMLGYLKRYVTCLFLSMVCSGFLFALLIAGVPLGYHGLFVLMLLIGLALGPQTLAFAFVSELNPKKITGIANGLYNMICMLSGILMQPLVGKLLAIFAPQGVDGSSDFSITAYQLALSIVPSALALAAVIVLLVPKPKKSSAP